MAELLVKELGTYDGNPEYKRRGLEWLNGFNSTANVRKWTLAEKLKAVQQCLVGKALDWYLNEMKHFKSWVLFESAFKQKFLTGCSIFGNYLLMKERKQRSNESVTDYFNYKALACKLFGFDIDFTKKLILYGLRSRQLALTLLLKQHTNTADLLRDLIELDDGTPSASNELREERENGRDTDAAAVAAAAAAAAPPQTTATEPPPPQKVRNDFTGKKMAKINGLSAIPCVMDDKFAECLLQVAVVEQLAIKWTAGVTNIYKPNTKTIIKAIGSTRASVEIDQILINNVLIYVVPNTDGSEGFIVGRSWRESSRIAGGDTRERQSSDISAAWPFANIDVAVIEHPLKRLVSASSKALNPFRVTLIDALIDGRKINVPLFNSAEELITLNANSLLTRRVELLPGADPKFVPVTETIGFNDIQLPDALDNAQRDRLLALLNSHRRCFVRPANNSGVAKQTVGSCGPLLANSPYSASGSKHEGCNGMEGTTSSRVPDAVGSSGGGPILRFNVNKGDKKVLIYFNGNIITKSAYPLPTADDFFALVSDAKLFTRLDLSYNHLDIPLYGNQNVHTTIGFNNVPFALDAVVKWAAQKVETDILLNYYDHFYVTAVNWQTMLDDLDLILGILREHGFTARLGSCVFASNSVEFLNAEISADGLRPSKEQVSTTVRYEIPNTMRDVHRFLRATRFLYKFVPNFAEMIRPIVDVSQKRMLFDWTDAQQNAFDSVKARLTNVPKLQAYKSQRYTEFHVNATEHTLYASIYQRENDNGELKLIRCISRRVNSRERSYDSDKLKLEAIMWAFKELNDWFAKQLIILVTDSRAFAYMNVMKTTDEYLLRCYEKIIQHYHFVLFNKKSAHIKQADKKVPLTTADTNDKNYMRQMQQGVPEIAEIVREINSGCSKRDLSNFRVYNELLYRSMDTAHGTRDLIIVPKTMRKMILIYYHDLQKHLTLTKTIEKITEKYYFPKLRRYARFHIKRCTTCNPRDKKWRDIKKGERVFDVVYVKHAGPFPLTQNRSQYVLVIIDSLSMFTQIYTMSRSNPTNVIKNLNAFAKTFKMPKTLVCDRSYVYDSELFTEFCGTNNIKHYTQEIVKRGINEEVINIYINVISVIQSYIDNSCQWDGKIDNLISYINNTEVPPSNILPLYAAIGYSTYFGDKMVQVLNNQDSSYILPPLIRYEYSLRVEFVQFKWKAWYQPYYKRNKLVPGTIVYLNNVNENSRETFYGPMVVIFQSTNNVYKVVQFDFNCGRCFVFNTPISSLRMYEGTNISRPFEINDMKKKDTSIVKT